MLFVRSSVRAGVASFPLVYRGRMEGWRAKRRCSVEEDGVGVSVGHLRHVFQYIFLGDDSQQPPNDTKTEREEGKVTSRLLHIIFCLPRHGKPKK